MYFKKVVFLILLSVFLVLLQTTFFLILFGPMLAPNLILAFSFALLAVDKTEEAFVSGFISGLIIDLQGVGIIGISSLLIIFMLLLAVYTKRYIFKGWPSQIILLFVFLGIYESFTKTPLFNLSPNLLYVPLSSIFCFLLFYFIISKYFIKSDRYKI